MSNLRGRIGGPRGFTIWFQPRRQKLFLCFALFPSTGGVPTPQSRIRSRSLTEQEFPSSFVTCSLSDAGRVPISSVCSGCSAHSKINFLYPFHAAPMSTDVKVGQRFSNCLSKLSTQTQYKSHLTSLLPLSTHFPSCRKNGFIKMQSEIANIKKTDISVLVWLWKN